MSFGRGGLSGEVFKSACFCLDVVLLEEFV